MLGLRRIRFRYTLRALFVFLTLFALWGGYHANRGWRERRAAAILRDRGATVRHSQLQPSDALSEFWAAIGRTVWREPWINDVTVTSSLDVDVRRAIEALPHLEALSIATGTRSDARNLGSQSGRDTDFPGDEIGAILQNHRLKYLNLYRCVLTNADVAAIAKQTTLVELGVRSCAISEEDLAAFFSLPRLRHIYFPDCGVAGAALRSVDGSETLESVHCEGSPVGVEFAALIGRCKRVGSVTFKHPQINDDFVAALGSHPSLYYLDLTDTRVTDQCIATISKMPALSSVCLPREGVSELGVARLHGVRPSIHISYEYSSKD